MKEHQKHKGKGGSKFVIEREIEMLKRQRVQSKRFLKAETVSKELLNLCLDLLEYLQKMKECSYIYEFTKKGNHGSKTIIRISVNSELKQTFEVNHSLMSNTNFMTEP